MGSFAEYFQLAAPVLALTIVVGAALVVIIRGISDWRNRR